MEIYKNLDINDLDGELWKQIENFPDYDVSNLGRIKSFKRYKKNGKILKSGKNNRGYLYVKLCKNKKPHPKSIHRLVLEAFKPNKDLNKNEGNHIDGNKENNYVENLEWCTHSENIRHSYKIGLMIPMKGENHPMFGEHHSEETKRKQSEIRKGKYLGEKNPSSKLTEKDVIEIWKDLDEGILTQKQIAEKFGVKQSVISNIKNRKKWKHIK